MNANFYSYFTNTLQWLQDGDVGPMPIMYPFGLIAAAAVFVVFAHWLINWIIRRL